MKKQNKANSQLQEAANLLEAATETLLDIQERPWEIHAAAKLVIQSARIEDLLDLADALRGVAKLKR